MTTDKNLPHLGRNAHPDFSFDGCGINGRDEYRTRLATLTAAGLAEGVGPLFGASHELLAAALAVMEGVNLADCDHVESFWQLGRAIVKAKTPLMFRDKNDDLRKPEERAWPIKARCVACNDSEKFRAVCLRCHARGYYFLPLGD